MKIALAQIKVRAGRPDINFQNMLDFCRQAAKQQADLIVFPELAMSGSFLGQAWASPGLLAEIQKFNQKLIAASSQLHEAVIVLGSIGMVKTPDGNQRYLRGAKRRAAFLTGRQFPRPGKWSDAGFCPADRTAKPAGRAYCTEAGHLLFCAGKNAAVLPKLCRLCQNLWQNAGLC